MQARKEYDYLKRSGDLLELFPHFTGEWSDDKDDFLEMHFQNEDIV